MSACGDRLLGAAVWTARPIPERGQPVAGDEGEALCVAPLSGPRLGLWALILAVAAPGTPMGDSGLVTALQQAGRGVPVTRRLLVMAALAAMLGLVATPALDETVVGGWFGTPWDGSRGLGQPEQQGEPAPPPTLDRQGGNVGRRGWHAKHPHGHGPKLQRPKGKPDRAGRPARPPARDMHAPPRPARR